MDIKFILFIMALFVPGEPCSRQIALQNTGSSSTSPGPQLPSSDGGKYENQRYWTNSKWIK